MTRQDLWKKYEDWDESVFDMVDFTTDQLSRMTDYICQNPDLVGYIDSIEYVDIKNLRNDPFEFGELEAYLFDSEVFPDGKFADFLLEAVAKVITDDNIIVPKQS